MAELNDINKIKIDKIKEKKEEIKEKKEQEKILNEKHISEVTSMELSLDWENLYEDDEESDSIHVDSASDGLVMSLHNLGFVDIEYISKITGITLKTIIQKLKGSIYQDPLTWDECFYKGWKTADDYLSGNLLSKLKIAKKANEKYRGYFNDNVNALEKVLPKGISIDNIFITLASPWIPHECIIEFVTSLIETNNVVIDGLFYYNDITESWVVKLPKEITSQHFDILYGTSRIRASKILEKVLNSKTIALYSNYTDAYGKKKKMLDKEATLLANQKKDELNDAFRRWIYAYDERKEKIEEAYNDSFGHIVPRMYDGSFLDFPNLNPNVTLFEYQKNAVARIIFNQNTLLAHDVGAGKTYIMISSGEELIRMSLSKKNMYVVPNAIMYQWYKDYVYLYPNSKIKLVEPKNFTPAKRRKEILDIINTDYNAIIIPYSCFEKIKISNNLKIQYIQEKIDEINSNEDYVYYDITKFEKKIKELQDNFDPHEDEISFDKLGITRLYVDEAHNFKNVPFLTGMTSILGLNPSGSVRGQEMMEKVQYMNSNQNCGVIMATGTPITNSIADIYTFQKYLQPSELKLIGINSFDNWISMYAEQNSEFEIDVDASGYRIATRLSKFHNLPELSMILANIADFHRVKNNKDLPEFNGYNDIVLKQNQYLSDYIKELSQRSEIIRRGINNIKEDNMLKVTIDGRRAALDLRLVKPQTQQSEHDTKSYICAKQVYKIYKETEYNKLTQLVFCDQSTPKKEFNVYDEIKRFLIQFGVKDDEIVYIHDASDDKEELYQDVRSGNVRILFGSTLKLGIGVNVQDKLIAIHHVDVPWRPSDMTQREGRILRQGNLNKEVFIYRYIAEGSFDAYSWQILETKQRFIEDLLANSLSERSNSDVYDTVLDYSEVKALAVGNPLVKRRCEVVNDLQKYKMLERQNVMIRCGYERELFEIPTKINELDELATNLSLDIELYNKSKKEYEIEEKRELRSLIFKELQEYEMMDKESHLMDYQGFDIILPSKMVADKYFIWLEGNMRHQVLMSNSELGCITRIDNYLESMEKKYTKTLDDINNLKIREKTISEELKKENNYEELIEELMKELVKIDKELNK